MTPTFANPKHRPAPKPAPEQVPVLDLRWTGGDDPESMQRAKDEMEARAVRK